MDPVSLTDGSFATHTQGRPAAVFVSDQCDINAHFGAHNIIINLTFCECLSYLLRVYKMSSDRCVRAGGDWAGIPFFFNELGGCPGDCNSESRD